MKYIVAVKYKNCLTLNHENEIFEFKNKLDRDLFINDNKPVAEDILISEIEDEL